MGGIVNVYKPKGWTSFDVVNKLKRIYGTKHIGHLGTLDPMAEGVLAVSVGKATKLFDYFLNKDKEYIGTFEIGYETDTLDAEGEIIKRSSKEICLEDIENILPKFVGEIMQTPPKFSAKKINGKRAYDLARKNIEFDIEPKKVTIKNLELLSFENNVCKLKICCSAGTYIRSLGRDIFTAIGSLATMTALLRTRVGSFHEKDSKTIEELEKSPNLIKVEDVLSNLEKINLDSKYRKSILNGVRIRNVTSIKENEMFLLFVGGEFVGIAEVVNGRIVVKVNLFEGEI